MRITRTTHVSGQYNTQSARNWPTGIQTQDTDKTEIPITRMPLNAHKIKRFDRMPSSGTVSKNRRFSGMVNIVAAKLAVVVAAR